MAGRTIRLIRIDAALRVAWSLRGIGRWSQIAEYAGHGPGSDSLDNGIDLLVSKHSARPLSKGGHRSPWHSVYGGAANHGVVCNREKNGICQSNGGSSLAVQAVASCTVLPIEQLEVDDFPGWDYLRIGSTGARRTYAGGASQEGDDRSDRKGNETGPMIHWR
jgi:hypothetical protein